MTSMLTVITVCIGLIAVYMLALSGGTESFLVAANEAGPIVLMLTCIVSGYLYVKRNPLALWTPYPWFLASCGAYFGFGPLVYHFGSVESINYIDTFYAVNEHNLTRTNLLNAVGIGVVVLTFFMVRLISAGKLKEKVSYQIVFTNTALLKKIFWLFLISGVAVKYLLAFPYYMGWITWTLPGSIQYVANFSRFSIILLFFLENRVDSRYKWLLYLVVFMELSAAMMTLSKMAIIDVLIAVALGRYLVRNNIRELVLGGAGVIVLYVFTISPFVSYARIAAGMVGVGSVSEMKGSITSYASEHEDDIASVAAGVQGWWTRLSYANAQSFALDDYDHGRGGDTIWLAKYVLIPRILYADKPELTPGRDFTTLVTGRVTETATGPGIFAEAYWNGGWFLVVAVCLFVGFVFAGFSSLAERSFSKGKYQYLPVVMAGITMGYRPDDWFVGTYVSSLINVIALYFIIRYVITPLLNFNWFEYQSVGRNAAK